ncbi:hypothetical protein BP6252_10293 [Coleophoma cylindrospora]|uniref:Nephrocystin 3-like N-terminal domain-containing protein n=1 Tax=Coleophoma cylindrospora TaxID=1849047 RepID=A0A3D8QS75_9HELO|nr:hypothetical protein BP6252_10293 [Coleophoma cylindrospora]
MGWIYWAVSLLFKVLSSLFPKTIVKVLRRSPKGADGIGVLSDLDNPDFEIVAVYGLGAHPEYSWTREIPTVLGNPPDPPRIHLLNDLLKPDFPTARILSFAHNSDWLVDAPVKTGQMIGDRLLQQLKSHRSDHRALCKPGAEEIFDDTSGIIFLGTPHQGSPVSLTGAIVTLLTGFLGSDNTLLLSLRNHQPHLSNLEDRFGECMRDKESRREATKVFSFYELKPTYLLKCLPIGIVVTRDSARGYTAEHIGIDTDHSGLNKSMRDDQLYQELKKAVKRLRPTGEPTLNGNQKFVVERLNVVRGAAFNTHAHEHEAICYPDTRVNLLRDINEWVRNPDCKPIFWLQGAAGTGKSTISRTLAAELDTGYIGASFFFKRGDGDRGKVAGLFTTIAGQIVRQLPVLAQHVRNAIEVDSGIADKPMKEQFNELILQPLMKTSRDQKHLSKTVVVIIDALDECDHLEDAINILHILSRAKDLRDIHLRFFVTSRPELPIQLGFKKINDNYTNLVLHDVPKPDIEHDILIFLKFRLEKFRNNFNKIATSKSQTLPEDWPGQNNIQSLVKMATPLFISAAINCRLIEDTRQAGSPNDRLEKIVEYQNRTDYGATYLPTLNQMLMGLNSSSKKAIIKEFAEVVGSTVILASPLSTVSTARFLGVST